MSKSNVIVLSEMYLTVMLWTAETNSLIQFFSVTRFWTPRSRRHKNYRKSFFLPL